MLALIAERSSATSFDAALSLSASDVTHDTIARQHSVWLDTGVESGDGADWKLLPEDIALAVADLLDFPARALPSRIEIRPARPKKA